MRHAHLPRSMHGRRFHRSPDAVADALCFVAVFAVFALLTWLVFHEILGVTSGVW